MASQRFDGAFVALGLRLPDDSAARSPGARHQASSNSFQSSSLMAEAIAACMRPTAPRPFAPARFGAATDRFGAALGCDLTVPATAWPPPIAYCPSMAPPHPHWQCG